MVNQAYIDNELARNPSISELAVLTDLFEAIMRRTAMPLPLPPIRSSAMMFAKDVDRRAGCARHRQRDLPDYLRGGELYRHAR